MSVKYYDEALYEKIQKWIKNPKLVILDVHDSGILFQTQADQKEDKPLTLPLIGISRSNEIELEFPHKKTMSYDGLIIKSQLPFNSELGQRLVNPQTKEDRDLQKYYKIVKVEKGNTKENISFLLNAIPIHLNYQIDIYTRYDDEGDEYMRNFVFNLINHPKLSIQIPYYDLMLTHNCNIDISSTISDNSDIPQRLFFDQFTRWTIELEIKDAYLFNVAKKDNLTGVIDVGVVEDKTNEGEL